MQKAELSVVRQLLMDMVFIYILLTTGSDGDVSITTLTNSGTISGTAATSEGYGIYLNAYYEDASITTLTNSGTISGTASVVMDMVFILIQIGY